MKHKIILLAIAAFAALEASAARPRLVVNIVVGSMRAEDLSRYADNYGEGGLRRLIDGGTVFADSRYDYQQTTTPVSLATLSTGAMPSTHGVIGSRWRDYVANEAVELIAGRNGAGPYNLIAPTLSEALLQHEPGSKAVTVAAEATSAIVLGGRGGEVERRTKVKSRVMANALSQLIQDSSKVYVMGHKFSDLDTLGAAAGVCCIARKRGKKAQIVIDMEDNVAKPLLSKLAALPEYKDAFISGNDAFISAQPGALLVVVDTNRPDFVESEQLLDACYRVAVIDHHRGAANYIESAALNFHEPYASSASELVTELLQYLADPTDLLRAESEALLSGIVPDSKNFTMRTGGRTFEAAAFLRRAGADTSDVQRLFQSDLAGMVERYDIIRHAELVHSDIAVAAVEKEIDRVTAAKAADELLTLSGIHASVVLYKHGTGVNLSARSLGEINVQFIMEKLGGGGNSPTAGGQVNDATVDEVRERLLAAIDEYMEE